MSKARLVITAVILEKRPVAEVARDYGVARSWIYELLARYREEGAAAFEPRSRRPHATPNATPAATVELVLRLRKELTDAGHDGGADTGAGISNTTTRPRCRGPRSTGSWSATPRSSPTRRSDRSPPTSGSR